VDYDNDDYEDKFLKKLRKQETAIKAKIQAAKRQAEKRKTQAHNNRSRIIGAAIVKEMETNTELKQSLHPIIDKHTVNAKDRKSLGLPSLSKKEEQPVKETQSPPPQETNNETPSSGGFFNRNT